MKDRVGHLPPLNALRAFEAAARHLNFRLAAEELGVTQSAVAQHVRALELDVGLKLFDRLPRGLALTAPGRGYAAQLRRAFEMMVEATASVRPQTERLTISMAPTFASNWLIPRLNTFAHEHPDIELRILATEIMSNFQTDGVDIAVRQGQPPFGPGLFADLLFENEIVAVCSPILLDTSKSELSPTDVDRLTLLSDAHDFWPEFLERALGRTPAPNAKRVQFNQTLLAIGAAVAGQGIAIASRFLVERELKHGRLVQAFSRTMRARADSYVVTLRRPRRPVPTEAVRRWLLAQRDLDGNDP